MATPGSLLNHTNTHRYGVKNHLTEIYPGVVEVNIDPRKMGRVKVRLPNLHLTEVSTPPEDLPWARPFGSFGGFHGGGSFLVPPVGATVYVWFLMGDPQFPVYGGHWFKEPPVPRETLTKTSRATGRRVLAGRPTSMGRWDAPAGTEVPPEILATPYDPTAYVLLQTPKGANLGLAQDRDAFEGMSLTDRSGQALAFSSPLTDEANEANAARRGQGSVTDGSGIGYDKLAGGASTVELRGLGGQGLRIHSAPDSEFIEITSKDDSNSAQPSVSPNRVSLRIGGGFGTFEVEGVAPGGSGFRMSMDATTGAVTILGGLDITVQAGSIRLLGDVEVSGSLSVSGDLLVAGEAILRSS